MLFKKHLFTVTLCLCGWVICVSQDSELAMNPAVKQSYPSLHVAQDTTFELLVFEGSDWCHNCQRLEQYVLSDSIFTLEIQKMGIALQRVDFPQRKKLSKETRQRNEALAKRYGFDGSFPTLILARPNRSLFKKINHRPDESIGQLLESLQQSTAALE